ncbi:MAG: leucine-rich repeat domain-containing protein [Nitrososphaera sp.]|nr:leucine-rich repeat domain-containing protein [Nitrososphaera sp.]
MRTLLLAVMVAGILLGLVVHPARQRQRVIDAITQMGGALTFDYQRSSNHAWRPDAKSPGSTFMKALLGDKYQAKVVEVELFAGPGMSPERFNDSHAKQLALFTELEWLVLRNTKMTDTGLSELSNLKKLERLDIEGSTVTEAGVERFRRQNSAIPIYY